MEGGREGRVNHSSTCIDNIHTLSCCTQPRAHLPLHPSFPHSLPPLLTLPFSHISSASARRSDPGHLSE